LSTDKQYSGLALYCICTLAVPFELIRFPCSFFSPSDPPVAAKSVNLSPSKLDPIAADFPPRKLLLLSDGVARVNWKPTAAKKYNRKGIMVNKRSPLQDRTKIGRTKTNAWQAV
jgi:hypothetical protein